MDTRPAASLGCAGISEQGEQRRPVMSESTHTMDPTFYRSPSEAIAAPTEQLAYVVAFDRAGQKPDALTVVDTDPGSPTYGQIVGWADLTNGR